MTEPVAHQHLQASVDRAAERLTSPTAPADPGMLAAAVMFTAATAYGSTVSIRLDLEGEPFGIRVALPVPVAVALGWGAALSAPWPIPAAALIVAYRSGRSTGPTPGLFHVALGITGLIAGLLGEPVVRTYRTQPRSVRVAIASNVLAATALVASGLRQTRRRYVERPRLRAGGAARRRRSISRCLPSRS